MATRNDYVEVVLESYLRLNTSGHRDPVGIRPVKGQRYPQTMEVECSRRMIDTSRYPLGTKFLAKVCVKQKLDARHHLYSYYGFAIVTIDNVKAKAFIARYPQGRVAS
jgi:hypothetical protein